MDCSVCSACYDKGSEARLAYDELLSLQERIASITAAIEQTLITGTQKEVLVLKEGLRHGNGDFLTPLQLRSRMVTGEPWSLLE